MNKSENIQTNRTEDGGLPPRQRHMVLGIMMAGTTAACISQSMMIAALPTIMQEFLVGAGLAQLITTAYIFTLGLFSAMSAYLVSKLDARRLFFIAMVGFIVGCCASLFATNYPVLLASRLVQAIGAGILLPLIQVVALSVYPKSQYGKAMGIVGIIIGFAPAIGPAISGFIVDAWGWRAVFVALGTVSAVVTLLAIPFLPNVMRKPATHQRFDALSAVLFSFGAICLLVATACIEQSGWGVVAAASITLGAVLLFAFARRQLRIPNPLLKLSCFANRQFTVGLALVLLGNLSFMAASIMVPLFVQDVQGASAAVSGLAILPGAVLLGFLNPITGRLLDSHGPWPLLVAGCALLLGGTLAFVACDAETPLWVVTVLYGVRICGVACLQMPMKAYASKQLSCDD
ncbi:MAG: MFS transporter, partial [Slackia isoflavoniconvertens]|nr:MFS transporter [Slackia isoflavoniconvertens]